MHSLKASGRLIRGETELANKYNPQTIIKAQTLVDLMVECAIDNQEVGDRGSLMGHKK